MEVADIVGGDTLEEEGIHRELKYRAMSVGEYQLAADTSLGKKIAKYRIAPESDEIGEVGQILLYRLLTATKFSTNSAECKPTPALAIA